MSATGHARSAALSGGLGGSGTASLAGAVTLRKDDLDAMLRRAGGAPPAAAQREQELKEARKAASAARAGRWPNTLAALRARKEAERKKRLEDKEAAAVILDQAEEELRLQERLRTLQAANAYFQQQNDKVKALKSFRQRVEFAHYNDAAQELRATRASIEAQQKADFERTEREKMEAAEAAEEAARLNARERARLLALEQKEQLQNVMRQRAAELEADRADGRRIAADISEMVKAEADATLTKMRYAAEKKREFVVENTRLLETRKAAKSQEVALMEYVAAQAAAKEEHEAKVREIQARRKAEAQRKAAIISGIMEADYLSRKNGEDARVAAEVAAAEAKAGADADKKRAQAAAMRASIEEHMSAQRRKAMEDIIKRQKEAEIDHEAFLQRLRDMEEQERRDAEAKRSAASALRQAHLAQAADKRREVESWRTLDKTEAQRAIEAGSGGPMDEAYTAEASRLLATAPQKQVLLRTMHKIANPPMIPNLQRM